MAEFERIGITFHVGKSHWYGTVVASRDALYLPMERKRNDVATGLAGGLGGAVGGLIAGAVMGAMGAKVPAGVTDLRKLPDWARKHPDWPLKNKDDCPVLVVPRQSVPAVYHPSLTNLLQFEFANEMVKIEYLLFRGKRVRATLESFGWPLKWGEKPPKK
jgi:hypothetical protein